MSRADYEDDKLTPSDQELAKWSDEALELNLILKKLGFSKDICSREFLLKFFESFYVERSGITEMDPQLVKFENI